MYDIISFSSISRLVKGRIENESDQLSIDAKKLQLLCEMFYEGLQNDRFSRDRLARMMKGQLTTTQRKMLESNELTVEDRQFIKAFSKTAMLMMKQNLPKKG